MKDLEFPITSIVCDKLLLLYKRLDREKIDVVLLLMAKENINLSLFTYSTIIDTKGFVNDITKMHQIVKTMETDTIERIGNIC